MKLYRYRPLNDFLFKELEHQEVYFALNCELNDPMDLLCNFNFNIQEEKGYNVFRILIYNKIKKKFEDNYNLRLDIKEKFFKRDYSFFFGGLMNELRGDILINKKRFLEVVDSQIYYLNGYLSMKDIASILEECNILKNTGIACFTKNKNEFSMWSNYAGNHYGLCLEFENSKDQPLSLTNKDLEIDKCFREYNIEAREVSYINEENYFDFFDYLPFYLNSEKLKYRDYFLGSYCLKDKVESLFFSKSEIWEKEKEYRILFPFFQKQLYPETRIFNYDISNLSAIYFGCRTPQDTINRIIYIMKRKNAHHLKFYKGNLLSNGCIEFDQI